MSARSSRPVSNDREYRLTTKGWVTCLLMVAGEWIKRTRLVSRWYRKKYVSESTCFRCGLPWSAVNDIHFIRFPGSNEGYFTCCEHCWQKMSLDEKVESVKDLYRKWKETPGVDPHSVGEMLHALDFDELTRERGLV